MLPAPCRVSAHTSSPRQFSRRYVPERTLYTDRGCVHLCPSVPLSMHVYACLRLSALAYGSALSHNGDSPSMLAVDHKRGRTQIATRSKGADLLWVAGQRRVFQAERCPFILLSMLPVTPYAHYKRVRNPMQRRHNHSFVSHDTPPAPSPVVQWTQPHSS